MDSDLDERVIPEEMRLFNETHKPGDIVEFQKFSLFEDEDEGYEGWALGELETKAWLLDGKPHVHIIGRMQSYPLSDIRDTPK